MKIGSSRCLELGGKKSNAYSVEMKRFSYLRLENVKLYITKFTCECIYFYFSYALVEFM